MPAPAYLLKSRHGIYYFRIRVAGFVRQLSPNASGEIRVSLNTRDKNVALYLSRRLWIAMKEKSLEQNACKLEDWEVAADVERQKYFQGKDLIARFDKADPTDTFALHELAEHLSRDELKNYVFAWEHEARRGLDKRRETTELVAEALIRTGVFTKGPFAPLASHGSPQGNCENDATLQESITRFLTARDRAPATMRAYASRLALFQRIIKTQVKRREPRISQITSEMIRHYADCVRRLPKNFQVESRVGLSSVLVEPGSGISQKTIAFHFGVARSLLLWLEYQHYPIMPNLVSIFGTLKVPSYRKRFPFERHELQRLLVSPEYVSGTFQRAADYWVPLIGLFTGAREAEICQLHTSDILQHEATGLWAFHFNADDEKRQKTRGSERTVPIHPSLQELGLINYAEQQRSANVIRLFPDEQRNERGEFSSFSKRFNRYKNKCGIESTPTRRKDFHSFRHNVSSQLAGKACPDYVINAVTGHSQAKASHAIRTYSDGPMLETADNWLKRLDYGIDLSRIRSNGWKKCLTGS